MSSLDVNYQIEEEQYSGIYSYTSNFNKDDADAMMQSADLKSSFDQPSLDKMDLVPRVFTNDSQT